MGNSCHSGHYVSNIQTDGYWILCNDSRLSNVDESCVKTQDNYLYVYEKFTETVDDKYPKLVPTHNWQEIEPRQSVPHGCEIEMNLKNGKRFVRLIPVTESTSAQKGAQNCDIRNQTKRELSGTMNGPAKSKVASQPCNIQSKHNGLNQMSENKSTKKLNKLGLSCAKLSSSWVS